MSARPAHFAPGLWLSSVPGELHVQVCGQLSPHIRALFMAPANTLQLRVSISGPQSCLTDGTGRSAQAQGVHSGALGRGFWGHVYLPPMWGCQREVSISSVLFACGVGCCHREARSGPLKCGAQGRGLSSPGLRSVVAQTENYKNQYNLAPR